MCSHARPRTHSDQRNSLSKFAQIWPSLQKTNTTGLFNGLRSTKLRKIILQGISTRSHMQPRAQNDPQLSPSIPRKYAGDFRTRTTPLDPAALDRQNTKILGLKTPPRAATCHQKVR